jgi:DNA processing protein
VSRADGLEPLKGLVARIRAHTGERGGDVAGCLARIALAAVSEPGDGTLGLLVERFGVTDTAARVFDALEDRADAERRSAAFVAACLDAGVGSRSDDAGDRRDLLRALDRWRPRAVQVDLARVVERAIAVSASMLAPGDEAWPIGLDDLGRHAPLLLWSRSTCSGPLLGRSSTTGNDAPGGIAVVGSRANSAYGQDVAAEIVVATAGAGAIVVSGGAYGIDAVAHRAALGVGAPTVAFLAGGIDQFYPAGNTELLRNVARHGAVMSETLPGARPTRWRFLNRNRLIAACSSATVVVEAGYRSGAINTAHHAADLGRDVYAVPGPITSSSSAGCHRLIADGTAQLLASPADLVDRSRGADAGRHRASGVGSDDPLVLRVLDALDRRGAVPVDEIARRSGLSIADATDALALAQLQGSARSTPSGWRCA